VQRWERQWVQVWELLLVHQWVPMKAQASVGWLASLMVQQTVQQTALR
jgi:hypothetical protein